MHPDIEPRVGGLGGTVFAVVVIALMCYLTFAAIQGEHGLFRLFQVQAEASQLETELAGLRAERLRVANRTQRLSTEHLDMDLLDERARSVLGLGKPDEIIIP